MKEKHYKHFQPENISNAKLISVEEIKSLDNPNKVIKLFKTFLTIINKQKNYYESGIDYTNKIFSNDFLNACAMDVGTYVAMSLCAPYFRQAKEDRKVYVVEKEFFDTFREVNFDLVQYRHLIRNTTGYVKLPYAIKDTDGDEFSGFWFFSGSKKEVENKHFKAYMDRPYPVGDEVVGFAYCKDDFTNPAFQWSPFPVDEKMSIKEGNRNVRSITVHPMRETKLNIPDSGDILTSNPEIYKDFVRDDYPEYLKIMYNLLVYLNTGKPDLREFKNPFKYQSPTSRKLTRESKELSRSNIIEVGFTFLKEKLKHVESWYSKPHLGWRWCGPMRSQLELVPVSGSVKSWKDKPKEDNPNEGELNEKL